MKSYIGAKIIQAEAMYEATFLSTVKKQELSNNKENREGYKVIYPDNYISWAPKKVFESAYREILSSEKDLIL